MTGDRPPVQSTRPLFKRTRASTPPQSPGQASTSTTIRASTKKFVWGSLQSSTSSTLVPGSCGWDQRKANSWLYHRGHPLAVLVLLGDDRVEGQIEPRPLDHPGPGGSRNMFTRAEFPGVGVLRQRSLWRRHGDDVGAPDALVGGRRLALVPDDVGEGQRDAARTPRGGVPSSSTRSSSA